MQRRLFPVSCTLAICLAANPARAQTAVRPVGFGFDLGVVRSTFDHATTSTQGIGSSLGVDLAGDVSYRRLLHLALGVAAEFPSDNNSFHQTVVVTDASGSHTENAKSSIEAYAGRIAIGVATPAIAVGGWRPSLGIDAGAGGYSASRTITNCSNCSSVDLAVSGGRFIEPRLVMYFGGEGARDGRVTLAYRSYVSGVPVRNTVAASFGAMFFGK